MFIRWLNYRRLHDSLAGIQETLGYINQRIKSMSAEIDRLTASVTNLTTVDDSLVALVGNLAQLLRDSASDPAAITALADKLDAEAGKVSEAVTANTPLQTSLPA